MATVSSIKRATALVNKQVQVFQVQKFTKEHMQQKFLIKKKKKKNQNNENK